MPEAHSGFQFGYNTNGYAHHRLEDALEILAEQGWSAVALTLDVHHLDPLRSARAEIDLVRARLRAHDLRVVVETGARFVLDPRRKHRPTLLEDDALERARRLEYLKRCADVASELGADRISFWAGAPDPRSERRACWERLTEGVRALLEHLRGSQVSACLEPEPGMLVETLKEFEQLRSVCPELLLALDVGHLYVTGEEQPGERIEASSGHLGQVTVEDMVRGRHDHLPFGQGDVDVPATLRALSRIGWREPVFVELGRHGYDAVTTSSQALQHLQREASRLSSV